MAKVKKIGSKLFPALAAAMMFKTVPVAKKKP